MDDNYALQGNSDLSSSSSSNESDSSSSSSNGSDESSDDISVTDRDSSSDCNSVNDSVRDVASTDDNYFLSEDSSAESTESTDSFESTTHQMMMIVIQADNILTALIPIRTAILLDLNMKFYREKWMSRLGISAISEKLYGPVSLTAA
jgi:hypothetical protein